MGAIPKMLSFNYCHHELPVSIPAVVSNAVFHFGFMPSRSCSRFVHPVCLRGASFWAKGCIQVHISCLHWPETTCSNELQSHQLEWTTAAGGDGRIKLLKETIDILETGGRRPLGGSGFIQEMGWSSRRRRKSLAGNRKLCREMKQECLAHGERQKGLGAKEGVWSRSRRKGGIHHAAGRVVNALHPERRTQRSELGFPAHPACR